MNIQQMLPMWGAAVLLAIWFTLVIKINRTDTGAKRFGGFWSAVLVWPVLLVGEVAQLAGYTSPGLFALSAVALPLGLAGLYKNLNAVVWRKPTLLRWPFVVAGIATLALIAVQGLLYSGEWSQWRDFAPQGEPVRYWAVYLNCLVSAFLFLYVAIVLIEQVQQYHYELPLQVVDTEMYQLKGITGSLGFAVGMAFFAVILVAAIAFGFLPFAYWLGWFHLLIALPWLLVLSQLSRSQVSSPSPFDHTSMSAAQKMSDARAQAIVKRAEAAVIAQKAYKEIGLTLYTFAERAELSASDVCLALLASKKLHFRGFIYQFRMKYARQVLMDSDAKLDSVTRRLKLGANGTASSTFLRYLERRR